MAIANEMHGLYDYSLYTYTPNPNDKCYILPTTKPRRDLIQRKKDLSEEFIIDVDFDAFAKTDITGFLELNDLEEYKLIEKGDTVKLTCGNMDAKYLVLDVERKKNVSYSLEYKFKYRTCYEFENEKDQIVRDYTAAKTKILITIATYGKEICTDSDAATKRTIIETVFKIFRHQFIQTALTYSLLEKVNQ